HGPVVYRNGKVDMVRFPGGYATIKDGAVTFHYYTQDYLGSNRAVVNGTTGAIEQTVAYYPYGSVIADLGTGSDRQPFKFGGKELTLQNGLNEYDFGARQYYPAVPHFTSVDPLCEKTPWLSPYLYCSNNPVNLVDLLGEEPSSYEAALMSACAYKDDKYNQYYELLLNTKWKISPKDTAIKMNYTEMGENGLQSMLFERTVDGVTEYAYAFAGTNSFEDTLEDIAQIFGMAPQYSTAIENAKTLSDEMGNAELTFVGHSLGGGEAAASSMATNRKAITFNRASVSRMTQSAHDLGSPRNVKNIITKSLDSSGNFIMEPLSRIQNMNILGTVIMPSKGMTQYIYVNHQLGPLDAHSINTIVNHLKK
ncbi:MAG: hypothetical protein J6A00_08860, partial [Bacteroides sp.]|nr:hypothetical protein [Bacteroides sp.]